MRPKVLLMDEPFAALDVQTRAKMQDFLADVWRDSQASVLFTSPTRLTKQSRSPIASSCLLRGQGRIKEVVPIDLPRPRDPFSPAMGRLRQDLTNMLHWQGSIEHSPNKRLSSDALSDPEAAIFVAPKETVLNGSSGK